MSESFFSSDRERRLWAWTLAVVVAIYASLGLARTLAGALPDHSLLGVFFMLGMVLVGATILTQGLKARPGGAEIAVALGVVAAYFMVFLRMAIPAERTHLIEYGVVAVFIHEALTERTPRGAASPYPPYWPCWRRRSSECSTNASRRFYPPGCRPVRRAGWPDGGRRERGVELGSAV